MKRIQRKRTKGWKMPENTVYVGRGSKWGNPFTVLREHRRNPFGKIFIRDFKNERIWHDTGLYGDEKDLVFHYKQLIGGRKYKEDYIQIWSDFLSKLDLSELKGKDLACWCPLDKPCHADVLLELCNKTEQ